MYFYNIASLVAESKPLKSSRKRIYSSSLKLFFKIFALKTIVFEITTYCSGVNSALLRMLNGLDFVVDAEVRELKQSSNSNAEFVLKYSSLAIIS